VAVAQEKFMLALPKFEAAVAESPLSAERHANLGLLYAFLGRKSEAVREAQRAVELMPPTKDALDGAIMNCFLALTYARVGENDLALRLIADLLHTAGATESTFYSVTVQDLRKRWVWDPLRADPRFQQLIERAE
jgi:tetratricopeptide (TPR) repeat protein